MIRLMKSYEKGSLTTVMKNAIKEDTRCLQIKIAKKQTRFAKLASSKSVICLELSIAPSHWPQQDICHIQVFPPLF